jgi:hypothetical protein
MLANAAQREIAIALVSLWGMAAMAFRTRAGTPCRYGQRQRELCIALAAKYR